MKDCMRIRHCGSPKARYLLLHYTPAPHTLPQKNRQEVMQNGGQAEPKAVWTQPPGSDMCRHWVACLLRAASAAALHFLPLPCLYWDTPAFLLPPLYCLKHCLCCLPLPHTAATFAFSRPCLPLLPPPLFTPAACAAALRSASERRACAFATALHAFLPAHCLRWHTCRLPWPTSPARCAAPRAAAVLALPACLHCLPPPTTWMTHQYRDGTVWEGGHSGSLLRLFSTTSLVRWLRCHSLSRGCHSSRAGLACSS